MFVAITSVSLRIKLESRKWPRCPAPGAPGVAKSGRARVKSCLEFLVVESVQPEFTVNCVSVLLILIGQCGDARAFLK